MENEKVNSKYNKFVKSVSSQTKENAKQLQSIRNQNINFDKER